MEAPTMARRHSTVTVGVAENIGIALDAEQHMGSPRIGGTR